MSPRQENNRQIIIRRVLKVFDWPNQGRTKDWLLVFHLPYRGPCLFFFFSTSQQRTVSNFQARTTPLLGSWNLSCLQILWAKAATMLMTAEYIFAMPSNEAAWLLPRICDPLRSPSLRELLLIGALTTSERETPREDNNNNKNNSGAYSIHLMFETMLVHKPQHSYVGAAWLTSLVSDSVPRRRQRRRHAAAALNPNLSAIWACLRA